MRHTEAYGKIWKNGFWLKQAAQGLDLSEVKESDEAVKSISWSTTFWENTNNPAIVAGYLDMFAESVHKSLVKHRFLCKVVTIRIRYDGFATYTRSKTVSVWTSDIFLIKDS